MTSQPGKQTITIHILTNILRSKGNQTMIGSGGAGSLSKIFSQLDQLTKKIVQLKSFKMFRNAQWGRGGKCKFPK